MSKKTIMIGFPNEKLNLFWTWNLPNPFSLIGLINSGFVKPINGNGFGKVKEKKKKKNYSKYLISPSFC